MSCSMRVENKNGACRVFNLNLSLTAVTICLSIINITDISTKKENHLCTRVPINVNEWYILD